MAEVLWNRNSLGIMDPTRRSYLDRCLRENLAQSSAEESLSRIQRILWLLEHLEEYAGRLVGFSALPGSSPVSLAASDSFGMVEIAVGVLTEEIAGAEIPIAMREAWTDYAGLVRHARALPGHELFVEVEARAIELCELIRTA